MLTDLLLRIALRSCGNGLGWSEILERQPRKPGHSSAAFKLLSQAEFALFREVSAHLLNLT